MQRLVIRKIKIFMLAVLCAFSIVSVMPIYQPTVIEAKEFQDDGVVVDEAKVQEAIDFYKKHIVAKGNTVKWDKADNKITVTTTATGSKVEYTSYKFCKMVKETSDAMKDSGHLKGDKPFEFTKDNYIEAKYNHDGVFEKIVVALYDGKFKLFGKTLNFGNLGATISTFIDFNNMKSTEIDGEGDVGKFNPYNFFYQTVYPLCKGIGVSLLVLMMFYKYVKECLEIERFTWQRALMLFAKTYFVAMFVDYSFEIIELFAGTAMDLFSKVTANLVTVNGGGQSVASLGEMFASIITDTSGWIPKVAILIIGIVTAFTYYGTAIGIIGQVIVRYIKILCAMAFAPIPLAMSLDEQHGGDSMKYIFWMFGVFLQAPIMQICARIYTLLLNEAVSSFGSVELGDVICVGLAVSLINGILAMLLNMAQQFTDRILP